jgi:anti-sigma factor RsiW
MIDLPLACKEFVELVTAYLDSALPERDRVRFETHLTECPYCQRYLAQMRLAIRLAGQLSNPPLQPHVRDHLVACFREWTASA